MKKIGLISDSHGFIDNRLIEILQDVDEIWHAGDIGPIDILDALPKDKKLRVITGNIDDHLARASFPDDLQFEVEGLKIYMLHIGGKPPRYATGVKTKLKEVNSAVFVCGHSHICKVEYDKTINCLYMNPGAIGHHGFHLVRTMLLFEITKGKIENLRVVELGKRGRLN